MPPVKVKSLDALFKEAVKEESWHDEQERAEVERFKAVAQAVKGALADVKVFEAGAGVEKDVLVVGRAGAGWAGLKTRAVES